MNHLVPDQAIEAGKTRRKKIANVFLVLAVVLFLILPAVRLISRPIISQLGAQAIKVRDPVTAEQYFKLNLIANWGKPWRAEFNLGISYYYQARWKLAQDHFNQALLSVPKDDFCKVALNLSWSYESEADELARLNKHPKEAMRLYNLAKDIATNSKCEQSSQNSDAESENNDKNQDGDQEQQQEQPENNKPEQNNKGDQGKDNSEGQKQGSEGEQDSQKPGQTGRDQGSLANQQQQTIQRNEQKAQQQQQQANKQQGQQQSNNVDGSNRMQELEQANQQAQERAENSQNKYDGKGDGRRRW